jgi:glucose/mannose-6-phosphate isomerase
VVVSPAERLPGWVGAADAVIAVSSSGATAETLAIATEAARRGCRLAGVGAAGSPLHRIAEQARAPFVPVVPAGLSRSMLWAVAVPLLVIAERLGVTRIGADTYELTATRLEEVSHQCRPASESFVNPGKSLALDLVGALPMVWGTSALSRVAARRFVGQLHENAKYPALWGVLPEVAHTQVAAFDGPFAPRSSRLSAPEPGPGAEDPSDLPGWDLDYEEDEAASGFTALRLILIADPDEDPRVASQRAAVTELAGQRGVGISELGMDGEHPLVRLAGVIQLADYASVYLAIASGIDPGQTVAIRDLRTRIE